MRLMNRDWVVLNGLYVRATGEITVLDQIGVCEARLRIRVVNWRGYQLDAVGDVICDVTPAKTWKSVPAGVKRALIMRCMRQIKNERAAAFARRFAGIDNG